MRKRTRVSGELRQAIERARERGTSRYALWKLTGVLQSQLCAFAKGREGLSLDAADKIAEALKLRLVSDAPPRTRKKGARR